MKNAGIIIFDEATSSLDKKNEAVIAEICGNLFKNKTMIIVTHEPNNFNMAEDICEEEKIGMEMT